MQFPCIFRGIRSWVFEVVAMGFFVASGSAADTVVYSFQGGNDGSEPLGDVTVSGSVIYGMTSLDGANGGGTIFALNGGGGFPYSLPANSAPSGSLTLTGSTLFGMTLGGGSLNVGSIFHIGTNGTGYTARSFTGGDGKFPDGSLLLAGTKLYGMAAAGGAFNQGTIFSINDDGLGFSSFYSFTGGSNGSSPVGTPVMIGSRLYGMTSNGILFGVDTNGANFQVLDIVGGNPQGSLLAVGSYLYGTTTSGGAGNGTVFRIKTDGTDFSVLHDFVGGANDGTLPAGSLTLVGSLLYGTTQTGGVNDLGTVFYMSPEPGGEFGLVHSFSGTGSNDGASPHGSLTFANGVLYGTTVGGGAQGFGSVFSVNPVPEPGVLALSLVAGGVLILGCRKRCRR